MLFFFLKIDNQKRASWPEFRDAFDFIGLFVSSSFVSFQTNAVLNCFFFLRSGLMVIALGCLVVGFAEATDFGCESTFQLVVRSSPRRDTDQPSFSVDFPAAIALIVVGVVVLIVAVAHFLTTKRKGILPRAVFLVSRSLFSFSTRRADALPSSFFPFTRTELQHSVSS